MSNNQDVGGFDGGGGGGGGVWTCINILLVPVFQIAWECMVLKNQDISKFEMDGWGGGGNLCSYVYGCVFRAGVCISDCLAMHGAEKPGHQQVSNG